MKPEARNRRWLALALLPIACGPTFDVAPGEPRGVILLSVDTLRADHLGCYGYERDTSPAIDALARRGTLFEEGISSAPWTIPAHMSMLTGLYPRLHGVDGHGKQLANETLTLAEHLFANNFATGAIVNGPMLKGHGFPLGFQTYAIVPEADGPTGSATRILADAEAWLREHGDERFFLFLHVYDVHSNFDPQPEYRAQFARPYDGPADGTTRQLRNFRLKPELRERWGPDEARHLIDLYDAEIRQLDDALAGFFSFLDGAGLAGETLFVLTSDHGEEFLEHGDFLHSRTLHRELVHVPFLLAGPGVPRGARLRGDVSLVDLFPTITRFLGVSTPAGLEGLDLSVAWREPRTWPPARAVFSETRSWLGQEEGDFRSAIRRDEWSLHYDQRTGTRQLFDLERDPGEQSDAAAANADVLRALAGELDTYLAGTRASPEAERLDEAELDELNKLGYR